MFRVEGGSFLIRAARARCNISDSLFPQFQVLWKQKRTLAQQSETIPGLPENIRLVFDDGEGDDDQMEEGKPWKSLLQMSARASWRVSSPHPSPSLLKSQEAILEASGRTSKQCLRTHQTVLASHTQLAARRERERRRIVNEKPYSQKEMKKDINVGPVYYGPDETIATLKHRLVPTYSIVKRVLDECKSLLGPDDWKPQRILDFGVGCGSSSVAALEVFDTVEWIHAIDPSQSMRDCAGYILEGVAQLRSDKKDPRVTFSGSISTDTATSASENFDLVLCAYTATELARTETITTAAALLWQKLRPNGIFVMIEPGNPDGFSSVRAVRSMLLECCPPGGLQPLDNEEDSSKLEPSLHECHIIAPCTHNGTCPMERHIPGYIKARWPTGGSGYQEDPESEEEEEEEDEQVEEMSDDEDGEDDQDSLATSEVGLMSETDIFKRAFCSFVQTMPPGDPRKKGEKFSYLVAQKRLREDGVDESYTIGNDNFRDVDIPALLTQSVLSEPGERVDAVEELEARFLDSDEDDLGLELLRGDKKRSSFGRIVRAPIKKRGHVYIDYCAAPGRIIRSRVTKSMSDRAPGIYGAARKSRWGGFWPDIMQDPERDEDK